jgi:hypothetical protein
MYGQTFNELYDNGGNLEIWHSILDIPESNSIVVMGTSSNFDLVSVGLPFTQYDYTGTVAFSTMSGEMGLKYSGGVMAQDNNSNLFCIYQVLDTTIEGFFYPNGEITIFKYNDEGTMLWNKTIIDTIHIEATLSAIFDGDTLCMTGFRNYQPTQTISAFLYKVDSSGDSLSLHTYGHPDYDFIGNKIIRAQNGDFLIAGFARDGFDEDRLLMRIAPNGELLWYEIYEGDFLPLGTYDVFNTMLELSDGSILLGGRYTNVLDDLDANLIKVDGEGNVIWDQLYGGDQSDAFEEVELRNDTLFIGGSTRSGIPSESVDAWVMALDTAGNTLWSHTYNPDGVPDNEANDYLYDFTLTSDGGMAFCGWSSRETQDAWIMKLDGNGLCDTASCFPDLVGITPQVLTGMPTPRIFPNPASDYLTIQNSVGDALTWTFYNQLGQQVWQSTTNGSSTTIDISRLPAGVYQVHATDQQNLRYRSKWVKL